MTKIICKTEQELICCGTELVSKLKPGDTISLVGPLGSGKTTFVKGVAIGLGIDEPITSPTYTITKEYAHKLCHVDAYRIQGEDIGLEDYEYQGYVTCIEWGENLGIYAPNCKFIVNISYHSLGREVIIEGID